MSGAQVITSHHTADPVCGLCEAKLSGAHPAIASWYREVKSRHINLHIAWAFRNADEQREAVLSGHSRRPWPTSAHNFELDGKPCSKALDLFLIDEDGVGQWPPMFYAKLNAENEANHEKIEWAGTWTTFKESCHFQLPTVAP